MLFRCFFPLKVMGMAAARTKERSIRNQRKNKASETAVPIILPRVGRGGRGGVVGRPSLDSYRDPTPLCVRVFVLPCLGVCGIVLSFCRVPLEGLCFSCVLLMFLLFVSMLVEGNKQRRCVARHERYMARASRTRGTQVERSMRRRLPPLAVCVGSTARQRGGFCVSMAR